MALHNAQYAQDQVGIAAIENILSEAQALKETSVAPIVLQERITQLCCQLDGVDTQGSAQLRQLRKTALRRVQALDEGVAAPASAAESDEPATEDSPIGE